MKSPATTPLPEFLSQPNIEASPAWELINGRAIQKPMPTLFHSRLQRNLVNYINGHTDRFEAVQELRCLVPPYSLVPDISVIAIARLSDEDRPLEGAPDWLIEIRSPDQSTLNLQSKILHCLSNWHSCDHSAVSTDKVISSLNPLNKTQLRRYLGHKYSGERESDRLPSSASHRHHSINRKFGQIPQRRQSVHSRTNYWQVISLPYPNLLTSWID